MLRRDSRGAMGGIPIVRRRETTATPTFRAIVRRPRGARASLREEDSVPADLVPVGQAVPTVPAPAALDFVQAAKGVADVVPADSGKALVLAAPVDRVWGQGEESSFRKTRK